MESIYAGLIQLPRGIVCKNEVLNKTFKTTFGGFTVGIQTPTITEDRENTWGRLKSSTPGYGYDVDWGHGIRIPNGTSFIKAVTLVFKGTQDNASSVYRAFPNWRNRLVTMFRMYSYDLFREPTTQGFQIGDDGICDKYTGLLLDRLFENKWEYVRNMDNITTVKLDPNYDNEGFSAKELTDIFMAAGKSTPFSQSHYFLSEACGAYQREDNRGCVIFASLGLEYGIIGKVKRHCEENNLTYSPLGTLGIKFNRLRELNIDIPITDYKQRIVTYRNDVVHKGIAVTDSDAIRFWKDCLYLIQTFDDYMFSESENADSKSIG